MTEVIFAIPYSDEDMVYDFTAHRYILTEDYVRSMGIDLSIILDTSAHPEPSNLPAQILNRVSLLVYTNIYNYGHQKEIKEFLMACNPQLRNIIKDAMFERLNYITSNGDLSTKSGAIVSQGTRVEMQDLIPSVIELSILKPSGLLHRGNYNFVIDETLVY